MTGLDLAEQARQSMRQARAHLLAPLRGDSGTTSSLLGEAIARLASLESALPRCSAEERALLRPQILALRAEIGAVARLLDAAAQFAEGWHALHAPPAHYGPQPSAAATSPSETEVPVYG